MNIDEMKLGDIKKIAAMFGAQEQKLDTGMVGKYVIVRCSDAGVHAGILDSYNGRECVLRESRRLWYWRAKSGHTLSAVSQNGLGSGCKIPCEVPEIHLTENCEILPCSKDAEKSIRGYEEYQA